MANKIARVSVVALVSALSALALVHLGACGDGPLDDANSGSANVPPPTDVCAHPNAGCPCTEIGETAACGSVETKIGSYVMCSMGKTTCDGTKWGPCIGDTVVANSFSGGGLRIASLGAAGPCSTNPCDPYCVMFADNPGGFDASPLATNDAGLYIPSGASNACICNQPSNPASEYANIVAADKGNPASCAGNDAGTATDNCNHDYHCVGGACVPYPTSGVNPTCTASPDYTLGLGCHDGTTWELQVCNRGYVPSPSLGSLVVAIGSGAPSTAPGACVTGATGASWPTGPTISGASADKGKCVINLTTTSIGAGQCINVNLATQCTQLDGVTPLNALTTNEHWAAINPSTAILAGATPLPECDTCNNYTAFEKSAIPPLLSNAATCGTTTCGTVCGGGSDAGADGGAGCHTYVSGTVYDPGGNIPLPGIAVFQPTSVGILPVFSSGVSCDTCSSVLPSTANTVSSTFSDLDGTFNLEVNATTGIPVTFQTGRWRRTITIGVDTPVLTACAVNNITVPANCWAPGADAQHPAAWPAANCKTRLPQKQSEGDIPRIAFATGSAEPFECSVAQFMGGGQEIGTPASGRRINLYRANGESVWNSGVTRTGTATVSAPPARTSGTGWISTAGPTQTISGLSNLSVSGTKESITASVGGVQTITHGTSLLGASFASYLGGKITLWGSKGGTTPSNNGTWPIATAANSKTATIARVGGVADGNNGKAQFQFAATGPNGLLTPAYVGGNMTLGGASDTLNDGTFTISAVPSSSSVQLTNASGTADPFNGRSSQTWSAIASPGYVVINGLSGMTAGDVGNSITFTLGPNAGNRGTFTIVAVLSATQVGVINNNAVADASGTLSWSSTPAAAIPDAQANLWDTQAHLNAYDEVILGCTGGTGDSTETGALGNTGFTAQQGYFYNFMKAGGRTFANHYSPSGLLMPAAMQGHATAAWDHTATFGSWGSKVLLHGAVAPGVAATTPHQNFKTWLTNQGAYAGGGVATPQAVEDQVHIPDAVNSFEWLRAADNGGVDDFATYPTGNTSLVYSFDTNASGIVPTLLPDGGAGSGCGRSVLSAMHVDITRGAVTGGFPTACTLGGGLSPNEAAFEYLLFVLSSCAVGGAPIIVSAPPAPPAPPALSATTFTREYHAVCPAGNQAVWQAFSWTAAIPSGTSIVFKAATAPSAAGGVAGAYGPLVPVGTASVSTGATAYTPPTTVDQDLKAAAPPQKSLDWLRIQMTFNPSGSTSPVLESWNQAYDCIPAE